MRVCAMSPRPLDSYRSCRADTSQSLSYFEVFFFRHLRIINLASGFYRHLRKNRAGTCCNYKASTTSKEKDTFYTHLLESGYTINFNKTRRRPYFLRRIVIDI